MSRYAVLLWVSLLSLKNWIAFALLTENAIIITNKTRQITNIWSRFWVFFMMHFEILFWFWKSIGLYVRWLSDTIILLFKIKSRIYGKTFCKLVYVYYLSNLKRKVVINIILLKLNLLKIKLRKAMRTYWGNIIIIICGLLELFYLHSISKKTICNYCAIRKLYMYCVIDVMNTRTKRLFCLISYMNFLTKLGSTKKMA